MGFKSFDIISNAGNVLSGLILIEPEVFGDDRGFFLESWNKNEWYKILDSKNQTKVDFVQDNHSRSSNGVLRGLHFQTNPVPQGKLVRCVVGEIFDVAVDIRKESKTFCQWGGVNLSSNNKSQLWIPPGFAHGFLTLSDTAEVLYKTTNYWDKVCEKSLYWDDKEISIKWPMHLVKRNIIISEKDKKAPKISEIENRFLF